MNYEDIAHVFASSPPVYSILFLINCQVHDGCVCVLVCAHVCKFLSLEITLLPVLVREWAALANCMVRLVVEWTNGGIRLKSIL